MPRTNILAIVNVIQLSPATHQSLGVAGSASLFNGLSLPLAHFGAVIVPSLDGLLGLVE